MDALLAMGFEEGLCRQAMERTANEVESALELLLSGGLTLEDGAYTAQPSSSSSSSPLSMLGAARCVEGTTSQYTYGDTGRSACTAIALLAARHLLTHGDAAVIAGGGGGGGQGGGSEFVDGLVQEGVEAYARLVESGGLGGRGGVEHASADEIILLMPELAASLRSTGFLQGLTHAPRCFEELVAAARAAPGHDPALPTALVLTKPPETVLLLCRPAAHGAAQAAAAGGGGRRCPPMAHGYHLLDSHARPHLGLPHAFLLSGGRPGPGPGGKPGSSGEREEEEEEEEEEELGGLGAALRALFPPVDLGEGGGVMAAMYNAVEATPLQLSPSAAAALTTAGKPSSLA